MNKDQLKKLEADLWSAADKLCANSDLDIQLKTGMKEAAHEV
jgi:hypothetical protein